MSMGNLCNLESLRLRHYRSPSPNKQSALEDLHIACGLTSLSKLRVLDISLNLLKGVVSEVHFANLRSLTSFYAFGNLY